MLDVDVNDPRFGKPIKCHNPVHSAERLEQLAALSGLAGSDLGIRLDQIARNADNAAMLDACQTVLVEGKGWLYIHGGPGNAKTVALMAMVNRFNEAGQGPAMYIKFTRLIDHMREAFREKRILDNDPYANLSYIQRFNRILAVKVLAIDEMDKARNTQFADEFRFDFLDERYRQAERGETVTLFASNERPDTLPEPIYDRIRRFQIVENTAPSSRPAMAQQGGD